MWPLHTTDEPCPVWPMTHWRTTSAADGSELVVIELVHAAAKPRRGDAVATRRNITSVHARQRPAGAQRETPPLAHGRDTTAAQQGDLACCPWPYQQRPEHVRSIDGAAIVEWLAGRRTPFAAVVRLADGRVAILGPMLTVGRPVLVRDWARGCARNATSATERAWWEEVARCARNAAAWSPTPIGRRFNTPPRRRPSPPGGH